MFTSQIDYVIKFENGQEDYKQKGWFLCVNMSVPSKKRSTISSYVFLQRPCYDLVHCCNKWKFIPLEEKNTYKVVVAEGAYAGYILYSFEDIQYDLRDKTPSFYAFVAPEKVYSQFYKWKFNKIGDNLFTIQNQDTKHYLAAHRYHAKDKRDDKSTWVMSHQNQINLSCWKINQF